jgi:hypothetical protein
MEKKASIRDILDTRTLALIAENLDKNDQKAFLKSLTLPSLRTNVKELRESKTKYKIPRTDKMMTKEIIDIMTKRMADGLAPPRELFTEYDWSKIKKGKSLNQSIFLFLHQYIKDKFILMDDLRPMIESISWNAIGDDDAGSRTIDFLIRNGIFEKIAPIQSLDTNLKIKNISNDLLFGIDTVLETIAFEILGLLDYNISEKSLKSVINNLEFKYLLQDRTSKYNKILEPYVLALLEDYDYEFTSESMDLFLSILGGIVKRSLEFDSLTDFYINLEKVLNIPSLRKFDLVEDVRDYIRVSFASLRGGDFIALKSF